MNDLASDLSRTNIDSTSSGPNADDEYSPSNPLAPSQVPEGRYDLPTNANQQLAAFWTEIDRNRQAVSAAELQNRAHPEGKIVKTTRVAAEIGIPIAAGMVTKAVLHTGGPLVAGVAGLLSGGASGYMKTRKIDSDTGEGLKEFVQRERIGKDRNIEKGNFVKRNLTRISKAFNIVQYRVVEHGSLFGSAIKNIPVLKMLNSRGAEVGNRSKEIIDLINQLNNPMVNNLGDLDLLGQRDSFEKIGNIIEGNDALANNFAVLLGKMHIQSMVSGFSEESTKEAMARKLDFMNVVAYALIDKGYNAKVEAVIQQSNKEISEIAKGVKRSYRVSSVWTRAVKSVIFFEVMERAIDILNTDAVAAIDNAEVTQSADDLEQIVTGNNPDMSDIDSQIDTLSNELETLTARQEELLNAADGTIVDVQMTQVTDFDTSSLTQINDTAGMPNWLQGQEIYIDVNNTTESVSGLTLNDDFGVVMNGDGQAVGFWRADVYNATNTATGERVFDWFDSPARPGEIINTNLTTYSVGSSLREATDTTAVNVIIDNQGDIDRIVDASTNQAITTSPLEVSDYQSIRTVANEVIGTIDNADQIKEVTQQIADINSQLDQLDADKLQLVLDRVTELENQIASSGTSVSGVLPQIEAGKILAAAAIGGMGIAGILDILAQFPEGTVWFGAGQSQSSTSINTSDSDFNGDETQRITPPTEEELRERFGPPSDEENEVDPLVDTQPTRAIDDEVDPLAVTQPINTVDNNLSESDDSVNRIGNEDEFSSDDLPEGEISPDLGTGPAIPAVNEVSIGDGSSGNQILQDVEVTANGEKGQAIQNTGDGVVITGDNNKFIQIRFPENTNPEQMNSFLEQVVNVAQPQADINTNQGQQEINTVATEITPEEFLGDLEEYFSDMDSAIKTVKNERAVIDNTDIQPKANVDDNIEQESRKGDAKAGLSQTVNSSIDEILNGLTFAEIFELSESDTIAKEILQDIVIHNIKSLNIKLSGDSQSRFTPIQAFFLGTYDAVRDYREKRNEFVNEQNKTQKEARELARAFVMTQAIEENYQTALTVGQLRRLVKNFDFNQIIDEENPPEVVETILNEIRQKEEDTNDSVSDDTESRTAVEEVETVQDKGAVRDRRRELAKERKEQRQQTQADVETVQEADATEPQSAEVTEEEITTPTLEIPDAGEMIEFAFANLGYNEITNEVQEIDLRVGDEVQIWKVRLRRTGFEKMQLVGEDGETELVNIDMKNGTATFVNPEDFKLFAKEDNNNNGSETEPGNTNYRDVFDTFVPVGNEEETSDNSAESDGNLNEKVVEQEQNENSITNQNDLNVGNIFNTKDGKRWKVLQEPYEDGDGVWRVHAEDVDGRGGQNIRVEDIQSRLKIQSFFEDEENLNSSDTNNTESTIVEKLQATTTELNWYKEKLIEIGEYDQEIYDAFTKVLNSGEIAPQEIAAFTSQIAEELPNADLARKRGLLTALGAIVESNKTPITKEIVEKVGKLLKDPKMNAYTAFLIVNFSMSIRQGSNFISEDMVYGLINIIRNDMSPSTLKNAGSALGRLATQENLIGDLVEKKLLSSINSESQSERWTLSYALSHLPIENISENIETIVNALEEGLSMNLDSIPKSSAWALNNIRSRLGIEGKIDPESKIENKEILAEIRNKLGIDTPQVAASQSTEEDNAEAETIDKARRTNQRGKIDIEIPEFLRNRRTTDQMDEGTEDINIVPTDVQIDENLLKKFPNLDQVAYQRRYIELLEESADRKEDYESAEIQSRILDTLEQEISSGLLTNSVKQTNSVNE